jgi:hypothetical protein
VGIGQVILGVRDLDAAASRFSSLGLAVVDGGVHPGLGTANRIVPLGDSYLELLGVVDEAVAAESAFGQSLLERTADGDRLVRWSIRTDAIDEVGARLGLVPERRQRLRPDGSLLTWQAAGIELSLRDGWLPFFMQWDDPTQFPGAIAVVHPVGKCALTRLSVSTRDPARLARWSEGENVPLQVVKGKGGIEEVAIATPTGEIRISETGEIRHTRFLR